MISLVLTTPPSSPSTYLCFKPFFLNTPLLNTRILNCKTLQTRKRRNGICRAEYSTDLPIGVAIGTSILYSLVSPVNLPPEDEDNDSVIDSTDSRFAVMGIISFIPYFNWLSWLFAWFDTGKKRYAVYAIVYLAPYLRPNLSISPEESWLPIASIILCIIHIQLEASIKNGDIQGLRFFNGFQNLFTSSEEEVFFCLMNFLDYHSDLSTGKQVMLDLLSLWEINRRLKTISTYLQHESKLEMRRRDGEFPEVRRRMKRLKKIRKSREPYLPFHEMLTALLIFH